MSARGEEEDRLDRVGDRSRRLRGQAVLARVRWCCGSRRCSAGPSGSPAVACSTSRLSIGDLIVDLAAREARRGDRNCPDHAGVRPAGLPGRHIRVRPSARRSCCAEYGVGTSVTRRQSLCMYAGCARRWRLIRPIRRSCSRWVARATGWPGRRSDMTDLLVIIALTLAACLRWSGCSAPGCCGWSAAVTALPARDRHPAAGAGGRRHRGGQRRADVPLPP